MAEHALDGEMGLARIGGPEHGGDTGAPGAGVASNRRGEGNRHHVSGRRRRLLVQALIRPFCTTMRRGERARLSPGTSLERIASESLTRSQSEFVHGDMSRYGGRGPPYRVTRLAGAGPSWNLVR